MVKYYQKGNKYYIEDYLNAKKFSSFLPSIAGIDGKPLWAFYANVGQCMGGFGVNSKDTPLAPFDSAFLAYNNIPLKGFRTFIDIDGTIYEPFVNPNGQTLIIERSSISIVEETDLYKLEIKYSTISHQAFPALLRKVTLTNKSKKAHIKVIDGLPIFLPYGVSNYEIHELTTLVAAYTEASIKDRYTFYRYTNRGGDDSRVVSKDDGSAFYSIDKDNKFLTNIADMDLLFTDSSLRTSKSFSDIKNGLDKQITQNKILGAFSFKEKKLDNNEIIEFISVFGAFTSIDSLEKVIKEFSYNKLDEQFDITSSLVESLVPDIKTSDERVNEYLKQSFFDNGLRGGFPTIYKEKPYYLFSRKHGDMERDYNSFEIPSSYFSSGYGNFRDVNQNRRNDLLLEPALFDYNIYLFFSLIEANGYNPLVVNTKLLEKDYVDFNNASEKIQKKDMREISAKFTEGYWIDHWTYNVDLLENFVSVYPDKADELLNDEKYRFYDSGVRLKSRKERYEVTPNGIRQYSSTEKNKGKEEGWLVDNQNQPILVNLASKIFDLILKKFVNLDYNQMGIEMSADKPGWNDSLNGLPGLLGSSIIETIELLRLVRFLKENIQQNTDISLLEASYKLFKNVLSFNGDGIEYWNKVNDYKEEFETEYRHLTTKIKLSKDEINLFINKVINVLNSGIDRAKQYSKDGVMHSYFINEVSKYHLDNGVVIDEFISKPLPIFLEGPARLLKLDSGLDTSKVLDSNLFDKKLKVFKMSESLSGFTKEIGRATMFTPGWLERESDFLHMSFKYLLGLLHANKYDEFFKFAKSNLPCFMDPMIYGRPTSENVSFIVTDMHPNKDIVGQGFYARLTGANTEVINMYQLIFFGKNIFRYENGELMFNITPHIPLSLFKNDVLEVSLFKTKVVFHNDNHKDYKEQKNLIYKSAAIDSKKLPYLFREGKLTQLDIYIK